MLWHKTMICTLWHYLNESIKYVRHNPAERKFKLLQRLIKLPEDLFPRWKIDKTVEEFFGTTYYSMITVWVCFFEVNSQWKYPINIISAANLVSNTSHKKNKHLRRIWNFSNLDLDSTWNVLKCPAVVLSQSGAAYKRPRASQHIPFRVACLHGSVVVHFYAFASHGVFCNFGIHEQQWLLHRCYNQFN